MPVISELPGNLKIVIYSKDHDPPHAHVLRRNKCVARIDIPSLHVQADEQEFRGQLQKEVQRWTKEHGDELTVNWDQIQATGRCRSVPLQRGRS